MIHDTYSPAVAVIPENHSITGHSSHHVQSDCGHYGSSQLKPSRSLLRNFSLRSRNGFSLPTNRARSPTPSSRPDNVRNYSTSASVSTESGASDTSSIWKKRRVKSATHRNANSAEAAGELDVYRDRPVSCPQGSARKRSFFFTISRLLAPFQSSLSSPSPSDDSPCGIIVSFVIFWWRIDKLPITLLLSHFVKTF